MKIKLDQGLTAADREYRENEVIEVPDDEGRWLIDNRVGHEVDVSGIPVKKADANLEAGESPAKKMRG